jgi:hypothetical protein
MADSDAIRARRSRLHKIGDHSLCRPERCPALGRRRLSAVPDDATAVLPAEVAELIGALDAELDANDRTVRALALRLAKLSAGSGPSSVQALRALGELVAAQRDRDGPVPARRGRDGSGRRKLVES